MILESIPYETFNISDKLLTLFYARVYVFILLLIKRCVPIISDIWTVRHMVNCNIICRCILCYGTNYPINRILICDDFARAHSMNTLFQLLGQQYVMFLFLIHTYCWLLFEYMDQVELTESCYFGSTVSIKTPNTLALVVVSHFNSRLFVPHVRPPWSCAIPACQRRPNQRTDGIIETFAFVCALPQLDWKGTFP
jgi:hypothetical protein